MHAIAGPRVVLVATVGSRDQVERHEPPAEVRSRAEHVRRRRVAQWRLPALPPPRGSLGVGRPGGQRCPRRLDESRRCRYPPTGPSCGRSRGRRRHARARSRTSNSRQNAPAMGLLGGGGLIYLEGPIERIPWPPAVPLKGEPVAFESIRAGWLELVVDDPAGDARHYLPQSPSRHDVAPGRGLVEAALAAARVERTRPQTRAPAHSGWP